MLLITLLLSFISGYHGLQICENGFYCVSDGDCQIGNHCIEFVGGKTKSTRCVPREDLDDNYFCSLSKTSCECE